VEGLLPLRRIRRLPLRTVRRLLSLGRPVRGLLSLAVGGLLALAVRLLLLPGVCGRLPGSGRGLLTLRVLGR
jgi:hypothetical protein